MTPIVTGSADSTYATESKFSNPGGRAPSGSSTSPACCNQDIVSGGSLDTSATKPSCTADPTVRPMSTNARRYCHPAVPGLGPARSLGTTRKLTRGPYFESMATSPLGPSSPGGSSSMNAVYSPLNMRSRSACTVSHTLARSVRKLPLNNTPAPFISAPKFSTAVT